MDTYQNIEKDAAKALRSQFRAIALAAWFAARPGQDRIRTENEFVDWWASFVVVRRTL